MCISFIKLLSCIQIPCLGFFFFLSSWQNTNHDLGNLLGFMLIHPKLYRLFSWTIFTLRCHLRPTRWPCGGSWCCLLCPPLRCHTWCSPYSPPWCPRGPTGPPTYGRTDVLQNKRVRVQVTHFKIHVLSLQISWKQTLNSNLQPRQHQTQRWSDFEWIRKR